MKRSRLILSLTIVCLLLSVVACGPKEEMKEEVIETPAKEMNFSAADLGPDWSQMQDLGLDVMPALDQPHIQDASMRMFGAETITGMVMSIVFSTKTVALAQEEMKGEIVQHLGRDIEEQVAGVTLETLEPPQIGDEVVMVGGNHPELGLNIYVLTFRKANVIAMFSLIGSEESVTEGVALDYARKLEAKIR